MRMLTASKNFWISPQRKELQPSSQNKLFEITVSGQPNPVAIFLHGSTIRSLQTRLIAAAHRKRKVWLKFLKV